MHGRLRILDMSFVTKLSLDILISFIVPGWCPNFHRNMCPNVPITTHSFMKTKPTIWFHALQWRPSERDNVSNHQPNDWLLNRLSNKSQSYASLAFVRGIHRGPANSPHKWPVTRKMFPFDDNIMDDGIVMDRISYYLCFVRVATWYTSWMASNEGLSCLFVVCPNKLLDKQLISWSKEQMNAPVSSTGLCLWTTPTIDAMMRLGLLISEFSWTNY